MRTATPVLVLLIIVSAGSLFAEEFDVERQPIDRSIHPSETDMFKEVGAGDWGVGWASFFSFHSYNITDIRGLDHSLATNWLNSFDFGVGARANIEYRMTPDWYMTLMPRVDIGGGLLNYGRHETFELETIDITRNLPSKNDTKKLSVNVEFEVDFRWRFIWFINKFQAFNVFQRRHVRGYVPTFGNSQFGTLDRVKDRDRLEWEQAHIIGGATGIGFEFFFVDPATRFMVYTLARPFTYIEFRDASAFSPLGFEVGVRSTDFELTDEIGLYFDLSVQFYLPLKREFNDIYVSQFSIGVKFR